ncbi:MAG TPA: glycosyltransferase family 39 protein, partial [Sedimentisphaerales bacterium]|nr:glycosyltransferase family 39 protein [Sedimentisphaerales bacterium]
MSRRRGSGNPKDMPADKSFRRLWPAFGVFTVAAVVRLIYLVQSSDAPTFNIPIVDAGTYDLLARNLLSGEGFTDLFWQPPFYPLWLAAIYRLGGDMLAAKVIQALIGSLTCVMVFFLGEKFLGRRAGVLAGLLAGFYMPVVFLEAELLATAWECFWFAALAAFSFRIREKKSLSLSLLAGACAALASLTRPNLIPVAIVWFLWLLWSWIKEKTGWKTAALAACCAAGFAMISLPAAFWSQRIYGRFSILPHSGGLNLYIGNNPNWEKTLMIRPGTEWRRLTELPLADGIQDKAGAEQWFYAKVRQYIAEDPAGFIKRLASKTTQFFLSREVPRNVDIYHHRQWSDLLSLGVWRVGGFGFPFGVLLPLIVLGAWYWRRSLPAVLWLATGVYAASVIVVFVAGRFRAPIVPILCIPASGGLLALVKMVRLREWGQAAVAVCVMAVIGVATSIAGPLPQERTDYASEMYFELGNSLRNRNRLAEAEGAYARAVEMRLDYADAHAALAALLKDRGAADEAV